MVKFSLLLIVLQILIILICWPSLPPVVPLFYSRPWGADQLIAPIGLFLIPCFSFLVFLLNTTILKFIFHKEILIKQMLIFSSALFNLLGLISLIQIIRLII